MSTLITRAVCSASSSHSYFCIGWCQRIKSEFKFEYAYLEDELAQAGNTTSSTQHASSASASHT